jgi:hypothetical protein
MRPEAQRWLARAGVAAVIAVPLLAYFWPCFGTDVSYYGHDLALQQVPFARLARASLAKGEWPFWNPDLFAGTPLLASGNTGTLTPLFLATAPLPLGAAITVQALLAVAAAYAGAAWLAWRRTGDLAAAALAGVGYALSAPVFLRVYAGHPHILQALAVLPWLLGAGEAIAGGARGRAAAGVAIATGLMLLANAQLAYLGVLAYAIMLLVRVGAQFRARAPGPPLAAWRPIAWSAAGGVAGVLLAMPQILPGLEFADLSDRSGGYAVGDALWGRLVPAHLEGLFVPLAHGHPERAEGAVAVPGAASDGLIPLWEVCGFVGLVVLGFAACAWAAGRGRAYGWLAGVAWLGALGYPLYWLAYHALPGFDLFRVPARLLCLAALGIAVSAGEGLALLRRTDALGDLARRRARWAAAALAGAAVVAGTVAAGLRPDPDAWPMLALPVTAVLALALGVAHAPEAVRPLLVAVPALAALELTVFHQGFSRPWPVDTVMVPPSTAEAARALGRTWRFDVSPDPYREPYRPNVVLDVGLRSGGGYDPAVLRRYMQLYNVGNGHEPNRATYAAWRERFQPPVPLTGVRYLLTTGLQEPPLRRLHTGTRTPPAPPVHLYEYPFALPRAFVVHRTRVVDDVADPLAALRVLQQPDFPYTSEAVVSPDGPVLTAAAAGPADAIVTIEEPRRVRVEARLADPGLLVLLDTWYPGWTATVDGAPAPVHRVDHCFRGVALPPGTHVVEFRYACAPFERGVWLALLGALGIVALAWFGRARPAPAVEAAPRAE